LLFSLNSKSNYYTFPISLLGEGKTVPVPPVRFCTRFQRFTVPTVIGYLIFYGSVPRFRFGSRTLWPSAAWAYLEPVEVVCDSVND
jgi:hypothetical protein